MDPETTVEELLRLYEAGSASDLDRMIELLEALEGWVSCGGFAPRSLMGETQGEALAIIGCMRDLVNERYAS